MKLVKSHLVLLVVVTCGAVLALSNRGTSPPHGPLTCSIPTREADPVDDLASLVPLPRPLTTSRGLPHSQRSLESAVFAVG